MEIQLCGKLKKRRESRDKEFCILLKGRWQLKMGRLRWVVLNKPSRARKRVRNGLNLKKPWIGEDVRLLREEGASRKVRRREGGKE